MKTEIKPFSAEMIPLAGNLLSAYRLAKRIDPMIAWTKQG